MKVKCSLAAIICIALSFPIGAQIQRRVSTQSSQVKTEQKKKTGKTTETKAKNEAPKNDNNSQTGDQLIILEVENRNVYISTEQAHLVEGQVVDVIDNSNYFIHPKTKKKIKRDNRTISQLKVTEVFSDYALCKPLDWKDIDKLKKGMTVVPQRNAQSNIDQSSLNKTAFELEQPINKQAAIDKCIDELNKLCPIQQNQQYIEKYYVKDKTVYIVHIIENKSLYKKTAKSVSKGTFYTPQYVADMSRQLRFLKATGYDTNIILLSKELGYRMVDIWYNKNKSESVECELPIDKFNLL